MKEQKTNFTFIFTFLKNIQLNQENKIINLIFHSKKV